MAFTWSRDRIRWYLDASRHSDYHRRLAEQIRPFLRPEDQVCDLGCGLGQLDLELAPYVAGITCVDTDAAVLQQLAADAKARGFANLTVRQGEAGQLQGQFDVVLLVFFGTPASLMFSCLSHARRAMIRVVSASDGVQAAGSVARMGGLRRESAEDVARELSQAGYFYQRKRCVLSFDQPLSSWQEAEAFVRASAPAATDQMVEAFLRRHLVPEQDSAFPWKLPKEKALEIFVTSRRPGSG